jgi:hypothetical protein
MPPPSRAAGASLLALWIGSIAHCGGSSPKAGLLSDLPPGVSQGNPAGMGGTDASVGPASVAPDGGPTAYEAGSGGTADATRAPPPVVDDAGNPLPLFAADSSPVRASDCKPGTYAGPFDTMVTVQGGGDASVFEWTGMLLITLVANNSTPQFGEFNSTVLTVAPGAHVSGTDNLGGMFDADISGQLDCASRMFVGTLSNGTYTGLSVFFTGSNSVMLVGSLTATYDPTANPVALTNGSMTVSSPQVMSFEASGPWSAVLQ